MKESIINLKKGLKGLVVLSEELENLGNSLFDNQVFFKYLINYLFLNLFYT